MLDLDLIIKTGVAGLHSQVSGLCSNTQTQFDHEAVKYKLSFYDGGVV